MGLLRDARSCVPRQFILNPARGESSRECKAGSGRLGAVSASWLFQKKLANHRSRPERAESGPLECHPNGHPHLVPDDDKQWVEATQTARDANVVAPA